MKQLEEHTRRSRPALVKHIKALLKENGGPIEEHASSPNDQKILHDRVNRLLRDSKLTLNVIED